MEAGFYAAARAGASGSRERALWRAFRERRRRARGAQRRGARGDRSGNRSGGCAEESGGQKQKRATRCRCRAIQCTYSSKRARHCQENSLDTRHAGKLLPVSGMRARSRQNRLRTSARTCERSRCDSSWRIAVSRCISATNAASSIHDRLIPTFRSAPSTQASRSREAGADVRDGVGVSLLGELGQGGEQPHGRPGGAHRDLGGPAVGEGDPARPRGLLRVGVLRRAPRGDDLVVGRRSPRSARLRNSARASSPASAIGRTASCEAAYFSFESVSAATISASEAPMAPAAAAAVPPPGVGASEARASRNPSKRELCEVRHGRPFTTRPRNTTASTRLMPQ